MSAPVPPHRGESAVAAPAQAAHATPRAARELAQPLLRLVAFDASMKRPPPPASTTAGPTCVEPIAQNVETIASLRARAEEGVSAHQRRVERLTGALGRPRSIYVVLPLVAAWVS